MNHSKDTRYPRPPLYATDTSPNVAVHALRVSKVAVHALRVPNTPWIYGMLGSAFSSQDKRYRKPLKTVARRTSELLDAAFHIMDNVEKNKGTEGFVKPRDMWPTTLDYLHQYRQWEFFHKCPYEIELALNHLCAARKLYLEQNPASKATRRGDFAKFLQLLDHWCAHLRSVAEASDHHADRFSSSVSQFRPRADVVAREEGKSADEPIVIRGDTPEAPSHIADAASTGPSLLSSSQAIASTQAQASSSTVDIMDYRRWPPTEERLTALFSSTSTHFIRSLESPNRTRMISLIS